MKGDMRQRIETMWENGASREAAHEASLDFSRGLDISRQARNKLLLLFYGTAHNRKPVRRTALAAVDPEWRVYGGSREYAIRFNDLPDTFQDAPVPPAPLEHAPAAVVPDWVEHEAVVPAIPQVPSPIGKSCLKNGPRAAPAYPRAPEARPAPLTPLGRGRPCKRVRLVFEPAVIGIEAKTALAPYKGDLLYSSFEMARSRQLALQGLLHDMPIAATRRSDEGAHV